MAANAKAMAFDHFLASHRMAEKRKSSGLRNDFA
jgi:hypothetical protein